MHLPEEDIEFTIKDLQNRPIIEIETQGAKKDPQNCGFSTKKDSSGPCQRAVHHWTSELELLRSRKHADNRRDQSGKVGLARFCSRFPTQIAQRLTGNRPDGD